MKHLIDILKQFDIERSSQKNHNEKSIAACFMPVAEQILLGGCLYVNCEHPFKIDIRAIELYYHEEDGELKDPIMYHTNLHVPSFLVKKGITELPYFAFGSFNLHTSGLDVTFENEQKKYRASFLIREYRVLDADEDVNSSTKKFDPYSTHIFDDLFPFGVSADNLKMIEWREEHKEGEVKTMSRYNVKQYKLIEGKYEKQPEDCTRPWKFYRV